MTATEVTTKAGNSGFLDNLRNFTFSIQIAEQLQETDVPFRSVLFYLFCFVCFTIRTDVRMHTPSKHYASAHNSEALISTSLARESRLRRAQTYPRSRSHLWKETGESEAESLVCSQSFREEPQDSTLLISHNTCLLHPKPRESQDGDSLT